MRLGNGFVLDSAFYATVGTGNTWTSEALHAAGLPLSTTGVVFASPLVDRVRWYGEVRMQRDRPLPSMARLTGGRVPLACGIDDEPLTSEHGFGASGRISAVDR